MTIVVVKWRLCVIKRVIVTCAWGTLYPEMAAGSLKTSPQLSHINISASLNFAQPIIYINIMAQKLFMVFYTYDDKFSYGDVW